MSNSNEDNRVFTAHKSIENDSWGRYQELVMKTLERLEDDIRTLQEKYQSDLNLQKEHMRIELEKMRVEISDIKHEVNKTVSGMEMQMKISDMQRKVDEAQNEIAKNEKKKQEEIKDLEKNTKFEILFGGTSKFMWILVAALASFAFSMVQLIVKYFAGM
jgi:hypothetical protein